MKKWEYKSESFENTYGDEWTESMNKLGNEGWELVNYIERSSQIETSTESALWNVHNWGYAFFKREI